MDKEKTLAQCEKAVFARSKEAKTAITAGSKMIERLGRGAHWSDYTVVALGLLAGVEIAKEAGKRGGRAYNKVFGEWLAKNPMYDEPNISTDDRAALINIFGTPGMVERWMEVSEKMTPGERMRVSTPRTVWDHIKPRSEKREEEPEDDSDIDSPSTVRAAEKVIGDQQDALANAVPLSYNDDELDAHLTRIWATVDGKVSLLRVRDKINGLERAEKAALKRRDKEAKALDDGASVAH